MISVSCKNCGHTIEVNLMHVAQILRCTKCKGCITVPSKEKCEETNEYPEIQTSKLTVIESSPDLSRHKKDTLTNTKKQALFKPIRILLFVIVIILAAGIIYSAIIYLRNYYQYSYEITKIEADFHTGEELYPIKINVYVKQRTSLNGRRENRYVALIYAIDSKDDMATTSKEVIEAATQGNAKDGRHLSAAVYDAVDGRKGNLCVSTSFRFTGQGGRGSIDYLINYRTEQTDIFRFSLRWDTIKNIFIEGMKVYHVRRFPEYIHLLMHSSSLSGFGPTPYYKVTGPVDIKAQIWTKSGDKPDPAPGDNWKPASRVFEMKSNKETGGN